MDSSNTKHISLRFMPDDSLCTLNIPAAKLARYIIDKPALVKFLNTKSGLKVPNIPDLVIIYRKSKKNKSYVPLETKDDFKSLYRSLEVKNLLKLKINVKEVPQMHTENPTMNEGAVSANIKKNERRADDSFKSLSKSLFFELSETVLQGALERFKEAMSDGNHPMEDAAAQTEDFSINAPLSSPPPESFMVHEDACCDSCNPTEFKPIVGPRFKCLVCDNFDLCATCESKYVEINGHSRLHPLAKINFPNNHSVEHHDPEIVKGPYHQISHNADGGHCGRLQPTRAFVSESATDSQSLCSGQHADKETLHSKGPPQVSSEDIVYDIPLGSCSLASKEKLENILQNGDIDNFFQSVDGYIEDSRRYHALIESVEGDFSIDEKFACLLSLADRTYQAGELLASGSTNATEDYPTQPESTKLTDAERSDNKAITTTALTAADGEGVLIVEVVRTFPRCLTLKINNASIYLISGSQLKFEFFNDSSNVAVSVPCTHGIAPGITKSFNLRLGNEDPNFPSFGDSRLRIATCDPNLFMEGAFASTTILIPHTKEPELIKCISDNTTFTGQVLVSLCIKAKGSTQIVVTNDTEQDIDCSDLTFEIINCFEQSICKLLIHKKHAILLGRGAKFNMSVSTAHLKYPFKLIMKNETMQGVCNLNLKNLSGVFEFDLGKSAVFNSSSETDDDIFHEGTLDVSLATQKTVKVSNDGNTDDCPMLVDEPSSQRPPSDLSQSIDELQLGKLKFNNATSVHSMILPTLPRESVSPKNLTTTLSASVYADANSTLLRDGDEDKYRDDYYDLISTDTGDDFGSDYEVLSRVTSNI